MVQSLKLLHQLLQPSLGCYHQPWFAKGRPIQQQIETDVCHAGHGADTAAAAIDSGDASELAGSMPSPPRRDIRERELITAYGALGTVLPTIFHVACSLVHHHDVRCPSMAIVLAMIFSWT